MEDPALSNISSLIFLFVEDSSFFNVRFFSLRGSVVISHCYRSNTACRYCAEECILTNNFHVAKMY